MVGVVELAVAIEIEPRSADIVVILTDHTTIDWDRIVRLAHRVYDTRNATRAVTAHTEKVAKL